MRFLRCCVLGFILFLLLSAAACQQRKSVCPNDFETPQPELHLSELIEAKPRTAQQPEPLLVEIGGKTTKIDKLVNYPICNDNWSGIVYISCDAQVANSGVEDAENLLFFEGCGLIIEPNTIVYVAAHNDAPFYKGCSCHAGEMNSP